PWWVARAPLTPSLPRRRLVQQPGLDGPVLLQLRVEGVAADDGRHTPLDAHAGVGLDEAAGRVVEGEGAAEVLDLEVALGELEGERPPLAGLRRAVGGLAGEADLVDRLAGDGVLALVGVGAGGGEGAERPQRHVELLVAAPRVVGLDRL